MASNLYETTGLLADYLLFHYASDDEILPWNDGPRQALGFPRRSVTDLVVPSISPGIEADSRALDIGCAVGASCYELSEHVADVIGVDFSAAFIEAAEEIRSQGSLPFQRLEEAGRTTSLSARRPERGRPAAIRFAQGDAMRLDPIALGAPFDIVHAANLVCRLTEPLRFLRILPELVKPGGQLLLTTPSTWLEEFTPRQNWPDTEIRGYLRHHLEPAFQLESDRDMPMLIRETRRKYQWTMVLGSRWRRAV